MLIESTNALTCVGPLCFSFNTYAKPQPHPSAKIIRPEELKLSDWFKISYTLALNIFNDTYNMFYVSLPVFGMHHIFLYLMALIGIIATAYSITRVIKGRHRTPNETQSNSAQGQTSIFNINNTLRLEPSPHTATDETNTGDNSRDYPQSRATISDQYELLTHGQSRRSLEQYSKLMKSVKNIFKEEEFAKYIFIRGLMEDNLKKEMYKEFSLYKGLTLDQLIDRTRLIEKIQKDAESLTSDSNSEDTRPSNRRTEKNVNFNNNVHTIQDRHAPNNNNNNNNNVNNNNNNVNNNNYNNNNNNVNNNHNNNISNNSNHNQRNPQNNSNHNNFNRSQQSQMSPKPAHQQQQSSQPANQGANNLNAGMTTAEH